MRGAAPLLTTIAPLAEATQMPLSPPPRLAYERCVGRSQKYRMGKTAGSQVRAWRALILVLAAGFLAMLAFNLPGHLTVDSVLELYEGRYRIRQSWAPSFYAWLLGVFDSVWPGTSLYIIVSAALLFGTLISLPLLRGRLSWWGVALAAGLVVTPQVLIYQAIVWKDVLFANVSVAGMVCLAWAAHEWRRRERRRLWLAGALLLLSAAALIRQNGVLIAVLGAVALGWTAAEGQWRRWARALAWGVGGLAAVVVVSNVMNIATQPGGLGSGDGFGEGVRVLQVYDLIGEVARDPNAPLPASEADEPEAVKVMRALAPRFYSPERTDFTDGQPVLHGAMDSISDDAIASDWRSMLRHRPDLYLRQRLAAFGWVFLTPEIGRCVPVSLGVDGPVDELGQLKLKRRWTRTDGRLSDYEDIFQDTPVQSHPFYALVALAVAGLLLWRRDPADLPIAALMLGGMAATASFFVISIACDYRYLYFLDVIAMAGLFYVAVDPSGFGRGRSGFVQHRP